MTYHIWRENMHGSGCCHDGKGMEGKGNCCMEETKGGTAKMGGNGCCGGGK